MPADQDSSAVFETQAPKIEARPTPFVTIDSASTRDIDDALWIERLPDGFHVQVAIADPCKAVVPGSVLDERARLMGATVYARDVTVRSMLPTFISADRQSLVQGKWRDAMLVQIWLDERLQVVKTDMSFSAIRVRRRLSYDEIQGRVEKPESRTSQMLVIAKELSLALMRNRRGRGALAMYDLARMMVTDEDGNVLQFKSREDTIGNIIVQEMMVMTNTVLASYCASNAIPILFRTHRASPGSPPSEALAKLIEGWIESGSASLDQIQKNFFMVAQKAKYEAEPKRHFALSTDAYCHMSSPLRRYADLASMRQLKAHLTGKPLPYTPHEVASMAEHLNEAIEKRKEERQDGYKRVGILNAEKAIESGLTESMADHEVLLALKVVRNTKAPISNALNGELIRRMENGLLTDACYDTLLTEIPLEMLSEGLIAAFASVLERRRPLAMHLSTHATAVGFIGPMDLQVDVSAPFYAEATACRTSDGKTFTAHGVGDRKKVAEQMAVAGVFLAMLGRAKAVIAKPEPMPAPAPPPPPAAPTPLAVKQPASAPPNSRGALTTYCQHNKLPDAVYDCTSSGPVHQQTFTAQATITLRSGETCKGTGTAAARKVAENEAAHALLRTLKRRGA